MYKSALEQIDALETGRDREMTDDEREEFFDLAQAYNRIMPWHEFKYPVPHRVPPMHDFSLRDTYESLKERRKICKEAGIILEHTYDI